MLNDPSTAPERPKHALELRALRSLQKHWLLAAVVTASVTAAAAFYALGRPKIYRASATLLIDPTPPKPLGQSVQSVVDLGTGLYWNNHEYYETQYRIIRSTNTALRTVRALNLHHDAGFVLNLGAEQTPPQEQALADTELAERAAAAALLTRLKVEAIKDSRLVSVSFEDADPARAQRVTAALIGIYVDQNVDRVLESTKMASEWLGVQLERLREELSDSELALHQYKRDKNILSVSVDDQSNMLREELRMLNQRHTEARIELEALRARQHELAGVDAENPVELPAPELLDSQLLSTFRSQYVEARQAVGALRGSGKGINHPEVKAASAQEETLRLALVDEVRNIQTAVERSLKSKEREVAALGGLLERAKDRGLELNRLELEYRRLERSKTNTEKLYSLVLERSKESNLTQIMRFNNISVVDPPAVPTASVKPRVPLYVAGGFLGGLVLGLFGAWLRGVLDRTLKTPEEIEEQLGLPVLGMLPRAGQGPTYGRRARRGRTGTDQAPELAAFREPHGTVAEASRAVRTNLMFIAPDTPQKRLLITSGGPSEGKTTVACSIAIAMAQAEQRVLLLDCDLRKPRLHRVFSRHNDWGVSSLILDPESLDEAELATEIPHLSLLPAGPQAPNPAELLQSKKFQTILAKLEERFDRIVIDSPPIAAVTDATVLSTQSDGVVFVVRGAATNSELARRAIRALRDVKGKLLGVVLNGMDLSPRGHESQYYYRYSYYGRQQDDVQAS